MKHREFSVKGIGRVAADEQGFRIEIDASFREGLQGLDGFSHALILWWCDGTDGKGHRETVTLERPYTRGPESIGVFATRSPARPNPIGLSAVNLLSVDAASGVIRVPWIDAETGTPVIDVKPYHPSSDRVRSASVAAWCAHWPKCYEDSARFNWDAEFEEDV